MNKFSQIEESPKFKEIHEIFEKIFRSKGLYLDDSFKADVFFMSDDIEFLTMTSSKATPNAVRSDANFMYKILEATSENGADFKKLKVKVKEFIKHLVLNLLELQQQKDLINEKIKNFEIDESINIIEHITVTNPPSVTTSQITPNLRVSISRMDDFPAGEYSFGLNFKKLRMVGKGILQYDESRTQIIPTVRKDKGILDLKDRIKDFSFQSHNLIPLDINYNDHKDDETILKFFSGTNLVSFSVEIVEKGGATYVTNRQEVLDIFLKLNRQFLTDTLKNSSEIILKFTATKSDDQSLNHNIICSVIVEVDFPTRKAILERIYYIFKNTCHFRTLVDQNMKHILKCFPHHFETINNILQRQEKEERSACGECGCLVF